MTLAYKQALRFLGRTGTRHLGSYVNPLKEEIVKADMGILFELYVGQMLLAAGFAFLSSFLLVSIFLAANGFPLLIAAASGFLAGLTLAGIVLFLFYSYPYQRMASKTSDLEANMPFAVNHMAAIAASGMPPFVLFKLLSDVPEYGEVANEAKRIVRNVEVFGMDVNTAIRNVAERTPNDAFRQFLFGIISTIETGGDLKKFFEGSAKDALFTYRLRRQKYLQTLSTYADFYTAVLIAAPLFFISILSVMAIIGGRVLGLEIPDAMSLGIYVLLPLLNTLFILFIHLTQPKI